MLNKKAQNFEFSLVYVIAMIIGLIIIAPIMLKVYNQFMPAFSAQLGNQSVQAGENVSLISNTFINFWDFILVIGFLVNIILLFITAFYIDTNPWMIILYIVFVMVLIIFAPDMITGVDKIYESAQFTTEITQIPFMDFIRNYFESICLGIIVLSGIVIYGKLKWFNKGSGGAYNY